MTNPDPHLAIPLQRERIVSHYASAIRTARIAFVACGLVAIGCVALVIWQVNSSQSTIVIGVGPLILSLAGFGLMPRRIKELTTERSEKLTALDVAERVGRGSGPPTVA